MTGREKMLALLVSLLVLWHGSLLGRIFDSGILQDPRHE